MSALSDQVLGHVAIGNRWYGKALWLLVFPLFQLTRPGRLKDVASVINGWSIASLTAYTACCLTAEGHSPSFLICDCCGAAEEIATPTGGVLEAIHAQSDFQPTHIAVEAHGLCAACRG